MGISYLVVCGCFWTYLLLNAKTLLLMKKLIVNIFLILMCTFSTIQESNAQCPMCKISAESNLKDGGTAGKGLNTGILYMFALPYLLVGTLGFLWYRNKKNYDKLG